MVVRIVVDGSFITMGVWAAFPAVRTVSKSGVGVPLVKIRLVSVLTLLFKRPYPKLLLDII
jgi:hypothetical protein